MTATPTSGSNTNDDPGTALGVRLDGKVDTPGDRLLPDRRLVQRDYLLRISQAISARLDLREVLTLVIRYAVDITGGKAGAIAMRTADGELNVVASFQARPDYRLRLDSLLDGEGTSATEGSSHRSPGDTYPGGPAEDHVVALPMIVHGDEIGRIFVVRSEGAAVFTPLDEQLLESFADQAAVAIQNAKAYAELQTRAAELRVLSDLSRSLLEASDRQAALNAATAGALKVGPSAVALALLFDEAVLFDDSGSQPRWLGLAGEAHPALVDEDLLQASVTLDPLAPTSFAGPRLPEALRNAGMEVAAATPVVTSSMSGALWVARTGSSYARSTLELLATLGRNLGLALEKHHAMDELSAGRRQLLEVIEHHPSGVILMDREGRIRAMNPAAEDLTGCASDASLGLSLESCLALESESGVPLPLPSLDDRAGVQGFIRAAPNSGGGQPDRAVEKAPAFVQLRTRALTGATRKAEGFLLEIVDLTQIREIEDAKTAFLAGLSHELKTPLALIRGYAETLGHKELREQPSVADRAVDVILTESQHLTDLVDRLLRAARFQAGAVTLELDHVDLRRILERLVDEFRNLHPDRLWHLAARREIPLLGDSARLREVFANLLSNAAKFSPPNSLIRIDAEESGGGWAVSVTDEGIGIGAADQAHVFERFFRASEDVEGTGLGLFMSRAVIEAHGGRISVESAPGRGSTFTVWLPGNSTAGATPDTVSGTAVGARE